MSGPGKEQLSHGPEQGEYLLDFTSYPVTFLKAPARMSNRPPNKINPVKQCWDCVV